MKYQQLSLKFKLLLAGVRNTNTGVAQKTRHRLLLTGRPDTLLMGIG